MADLVPTLNARCSPGLRCAAFAVLLSGSVWAEPPATEPAGDRVVEVYQSAYHVPLFHNEFVTVIDVNFQPGRSSDFHHHRDDSLNIYLVDYPAKAEGQNYGGPVTILRDGKPMPRKGEVSFNNFEDKPIINRGVNAGSTPMKVIETELSGRRVFGYAPAERESPYTKLLDNERVKVWRLTLNPGETAPEIVQKAPGMRVVVEGGEIAESYPGMSDRGMWLEDGKVYWQDPGVQRAVKNIGKTPVMLVELEVK